MFFVMSKKHVDVEMSANGDAVYCTAQTISGKLATHQQHRSWKLQKQERVASGLEMPKM